MSERDDGGPAFPEPEAVGPAGDVYPSREGMSLRDWFAAHAPDSPINWPNPKMAADFVGVETPSPDDVNAIAAMSAAIRAKLAYMYADAMLAARYK